MITLIHGDDIKSSRNYFLEQKSLKKNPASLNGENISLTDIVQLLEGKGLFEDNNTIFIEDFFSKKKGRELEEILSLVNTHSLSEIIFWEGKILTPKQISSLKKAEVRLFKLPQTIFSFLDSLRPQWGKQLVILFHQALKNTDAEFIFYMLIRQFRLLLALSDNSKNVIEEAVRLAPWQKTKLQKQANLFSVEELKIVYNNLYEMDLSQKTGALNMTLTQAIDMLLLKI